MAHEFARKLRKSMTDAERRLWHHIKLRQLDGRKFRRQAPIGNYIVDFICFEARLIVESDGGQHASQVEADDARTAWLEVQGFRVMRFWNHQVFEDLEPVLEAIWIATRDAPHPNPPPLYGPGTWYTGVRRHGRHIEALRWLPKGGQPCRGTRCRPCRSDWSS